MHHCHQDEKQDIHRIVILFYKYFSSIELNESDVSQMQIFQQSLCTKLNLKGRILLSNEGINGSLSASSDEVVDQYIHEMEQFGINNSDHANTTTNLRSENRNARYVFRNIDWKRSVVEEELASQIKTPFPDLKISIQNEIVSTGNVIIVSELSKWGGMHLSPEEFHKVLLSYAFKDDDESDEQNKKELVLIDVRNTFEYAIGRFMLKKQPNNPKQSNDTAENSKSSENKMNESSIEAMNPLMTNFSSFDTNFCAKNSEYLKNKKVLMYCTGGIRCEKASAMLRKRGVEDVSQLSGGIHRYLERYGDKGFFKGKNFVFDQRVAISPSDAYAAQNDSSSTSSTNQNAEANITTIVGKCIQCHDPYDEISGSRLCTVCRDLVLVCSKCQSKLQEYHCETHLHWKHCYFTFLGPFSIELLQTQKEDLQKLLNTCPLAISSKNVRKTLTKQIQKVSSRIKDLQSGKAEVNKNAPKRCRTCFESMTDGCCDGLCWGFWKHAHMNTNKNETNIKTNSSTHSAIIDTTKIDSMISMDITPKAFPLPPIGARVEPGPDWNEIRYGSKSSFLKRRGIVLDYKSWASGGVGGKNDGEKTYNDCLVVKWIPIQQNKDKYEKEQNQIESKTSMVTSSTQIYRWGVITLNGKRMYDVQLPKCNI